ncbi:Glutamyl-tRNA(Gln) amidotransferase subunit B, chloroplastic/mitochondrial [subsurface metagenome]
MKKRFSPKKNYEKTRSEISYVTRKKATPDDYKRIGFKSGLEIHQQLKTKKKLFCHCPAGIYHEHDDYNAEIIRHMRPTLSELGEYDGTALMEYKTRKQIIYRINNQTACTYDIDDTPPFPINKEALEIALEVSLLSGLNIVGEVHITRKQYLDGSIPTGFQRTAILGVEGEIQLKNKKVRLLQLSIEEDSCREISDIRHTRVFKTDRLGMPLIETVTYPDMDNPDELREAAEYIRFLNRSTGRVRIGIGSGREDVNVSCSGGTRVEIKGVSHNKWIPELSHNEAFRQFSLLHIRELLKERVTNGKKWKIRSEKIDPRDLGLEDEYIQKAYNDNFEIYAVNLPSFKGILSHFTQPGKIFADEITDRLKVIACIEKPNMIHTEMLEDHINNKDLKIISGIIELKEDDALIVLWGPKEDIPTALETVEERCQMAFIGVPNETRKSNPDGTTIFKRVLPGANRMYPDTDSAPIPLEADYIESLQKNLPQKVAERFRQMKEWGIPSDTYHYLLSKDLVSMIEQINLKFGFDPKFMGVFWGHTFKNIEGKMPQHKNFSYNKIYGLFKFIHNEKLQPSIAKRMLPEIYEHPDMEFSSVLIIINFRKKSMDELLAPIDFLYEKFKEIKLSNNNKNTVNWLMGQVYKQAIGNVEMKKLSEEIEKIVKNNHDKN